MLVALRHHSLRSVTSIHFRAGEGSGSEGRVSLEIGERLSVLGAGGGMTRRRLGQSGHSEALWGPSHK